MTTPITSPQGTEQRQALAELGRDDILIVVVIPRKRQPPTLVSRNRRPPIRAIPTIRQEIEGRDSHRCRPTLGEGRTSAQTCAARLRIGNRSRRSAPISC